MSTSAARPASSAAPLGSVSPSSCPVGAAVVVIIIMSCGVVNAAAGGVTDVDHKYNVVMRGPFSQHAAPSLSSASARESGVTVAAAVSDATASAVDAQSGRVVPKGYEGRPMVPFTLRNGTKCHCFLPKGVDDRAAAGKGKVDPLQQQRLAERRAGTPVPASIASLVHNGLAGHCAAKVEGWWIYELCWQKRVRQFHQNNQQDVETEYILGEGPLSQLKDGATGDLVFGYDSLHGSYIGTNYYNGTLCDLTMRPREIELRLQCLPQDATASEKDDAITINEIATCRYVFRLKHPSACLVPELRKAQQVTSDIDCFTLV